MVGRDRRRRAVAGALAGLALGLALGLGLAGDPGPRRSGEGTFAWRTGLDDELQPVGAALAEAVEQIPVYLPAQPPGGAGGGQARYDAAPDRYTVAWLDGAAYLSGAPRGALLLDYPVLEGGARAADLGRGVTGYVRACARGQGRRCPAAAVTWRTAGWTFAVWAPGSGPAAAGRAQQAARALVSALPGYLNPGPPGSSGQMTVRLDRGQEQAAILWFHPEADLLVFHRRSARDAMTMMQLLEQVD